MNFTNSMYGGESVATPTCNADVETMQGAARATDVFRGQQTLQAKQVFEFGELFGLEAKNRYKISTPENPDQIQFFAQESSEGCERVCCSLCRGLTMNLHEGKDRNGPVVLSMKKKFHCAMCPWPILLHPGMWIVTCPWICIACNTAPPELFVTRNGVSLGSIVDPKGPMFRCVGNSVIRDAAGIEILELGPHGVCADMCCPCGADSIVEVHKKGTSEVVARITRKQLTCAEVCGKTNRFQVDFQTVTDPTHKALLFGAALLFDLIYWEQNK